MANRYSQPREAEHISTYVGDPVELMHQALQMKQQQYDQRKLMAHSQMSELLGMEVYGEAAGGYLANVQEQFGGVLNELSGQDLLDPQNQKKLDMAIMGIAGDKELKRHLATNGKIKEWFDNKDELIAKNKLVEANTYEYETALMNYNKTGKIDDILDQTTIAEGVDRYSELDKYFSQIKASGADAINYLATEAGDPIAYKTGWKGVSDTRISKAVDEVLGMVYNSPVGRELDREAKMRLGKDYTPEKGLMYIKQNLYSVGSQRVHGESSTNIDGALNARRKEKKDAISLKGFTPLANGPQDKEVVVGATFDDNGTLVPEDLGIGGKLGRILKESLTKDLTTMIDLVPEIWNSKAADADSKEFIRQTIGLKSFAGANGVTDKEAYDQQAKPIQREVVQNAEVAEQYNKILFEGKDGLAGIINYGIFDEASNKNIQAREVLISSLNRQGADLDKDATVSEINQAVSEMKLDYQINGVITPDPVSPFSLQMILGNESLQVDLTKNGTENPFVYSGMSEKAKEAKEQEFRKHYEAHMDAKLKHQGYLVQEGFNEKKEQGIYNTYLDPKGKNGITTKFIKIN